MELRHLKHFVGVVEYGNLSRAAKALHITQPALTRSIHMLEEQLGTQLLNRYSRGVTPTEAGTLLLRHAKLLLNGVTTVKQELRALQKGTRGTVAVGVASLFANSIVDEAIHALAQRQPDVTVSVTVGMFEEMAERLRDGCLDFVFSVAPPMPTVRDVVFEPLVDIRSFAVAAPSHPLAQRRSVSLAELQAARWALVDQRQMTAFMSQFFAAEGLSAPASVVLSNSLELLRALVRRGDFVTMLAANWIHDDIERGELAVIAAPGLPVRRKAGLVYRAESPTHGAADALMEQIRAICARDPLPRPVALAEPAG